MLKEKLMLLLEVIYNVNLFDENIEYKYWWEIKFSFYISEICESVISKYIGILNRLRIFFFVIYCGVFFEYLIGEIINIIREGLKGSF